MSDRQTRILQLVTEEERVEVTRLATALGVSQVTVRKDLDTLEMRGLIRREHGFAVLGAPDDMSTRLAYHYDIKRRIAEAAAGMVGAGETVMIESGSCCALLAEILVQRGAEVVTNSAFIAGFVRRPGARVVLLGGDYQPESQAMVGPMAALCAEQFYVDKLFLGTDGYTLEAGFTGRDLRRVGTAQAMRRRARQAIILTESEKFGRQGVVSLLPVKEIDLLYTDEQLSSEMRDSLTQQGLEVFTV